MKEGKDLKRSQKKIITKEVTALKKMRELKGFSRKDAAPLVGVTFKLIEQLENGRVELTQKKIDLYCKAYGFSKKQYLDICSGKVGKVKKEINKESIKIIEHNKLRRSYKQIITKEAQVLCALRKLKNMTQYEASCICGYSKSTIGHIEKGRIELPISRVMHIVKSYEYTMKEFEAHMKAETLITDIQDECIQVINGLNEDKLKIVRLFLLSFKK